MLALSTVLLLAQAAAPEERAAPPSFGLEAASPRQCPAVLVTSPVRGAERPAGTFSVSRALDLHFRALLRPPLPGEHLVELKLYTPNRHLYQTLTIPFRGSADEDGKARGRGWRKLPGFPLPIEEQRPAAASLPGLPRFWVSSRLPVAGSYVTTSGLYGRWWVVPFLDRSSRPCGDPGSFVLEP